VRATVVEAELGADALSIRCLPADEETIVCAVREFIELLRNHAPPSRGTNGHNVTSRRRKARIGLVCRNVLLANSAARAAHSLGLEVPDQVTIVVSRNFLYTSSAEEYPFTRPTFSPEEQGAHLGRLLLRQANRELTEAEHVVVPMTLELPSR
jgi:DNA-binding LacI/PurR family transcriptional regulator